MAARTKLDSIGFAEKICNTEAQDNQLSASGALKNTFKLITATKQLTVTPGTCGSPLVQLVLIWARTKTFFHEGSQISFQMCMSCGYNDNQAQGKVSNRSFFCFLI